MKEEIGINEKFGLEEEEPKLDDLMKNLKCNTDPMNFKSLMRKEQQVFKNQDQRKLARKIYAKDEMTSGYKDI